MEKFWPFTSSTDTITISDVHKEIEKPFNLQSSLDKTKCIAYDAGSGLTIATCSRTPEQEWSRIATTALSQIQQPVVDNVPKHESVTPETTPPSTSATPITATPITATPATSDVPATPSIAAPSTATPPASDTPITDTPAAIAATTPSTPVTPTEKFIGYIKARLSIFDVLFWILVMYAVYRLYKK